MSYGVNIDDFKNNKWTRRSMFYKNINNDLQATLHCYFIREKQGENGMDGIWGLYPSSIWGSVRNSTNFAGHLGRTGQGICYRSISRAPDINVKKTQEPTRGHPTHIQPQTSFASTHPFQFIEPLPSIKNCIGVIYMFTIEPRHAAT